ncbi:MAG: hypothetical protein GY811_12190 [Myxococcales bacterium]|nr:hypothetical protein [Myxococcales bacterium]
MTQAAVDSLFAHFKGISAAAESAPTLRRLVLRLAMQGRLTERLATDESVELLLANIKDTHLANRKKTRKKIATEPAVALYSIPPTWRWVRFDKIATIASNLVKPQDYLDEPHIAPNHIEKATGRLLEYTTVREDGVRSNKHRFFAGQVLYSKIRPNLAKSVVVDFQGLCSADMYPLNSHMNVEFLHLYTLSQPFLECVTSDDNRLAMPKVNQEQLSAVPVPVPPTQEQQRIVAEVRQALGLCDELEAKQRQQRQARTRLNEACLDRLLTAQTPDEFTEHWQRIHDNFDLLYDDSSIVASLRPAVLSLGTSGHLTGHSLNSWPKASIGSLLREKSLNGISTRPSNEPHGTEILRISAGTARQDFLIAEEEHKYLEADEATRMKFSVEPGDLFACRFNGNLHYVGLFSLYTGYRQVEQLYPDKLIRFRVDLGRCLPEYVRYAMNSPETRGDVEKFCATTAGNIGISATKLKTVEIPLPPLECQRRIVERIEAVLSMCEMLQAALGQREAAAERLLGALTHRLATAPPSAEAARLPAAPLVPHVALSIEA